MKYIFFVVYRSVKGYEDFNVCKNVVRRGFLDMFVCIRLILLVVKVIEIFLWLVYKLRVFLFIVNLIDYI